MYYSLNYFVGGFVDTYIQEKFIFKSIKEKNQILVKFTANKYSHIKGEAVNLALCHTVDEYVHLLLVCKEYRLPYITGYSV